MLRSSRRLFSSGPHKVVMLYDGSCPLCAREVAFLQTFTRAPLVRFLNVATAPPAAIAPYTAQPAAALLDEMHVFDLSTSTMHRRVDAFRKLYGTLGYSFLEFTRFWPFDALSDRAYTFIAANKHRLAPLFPEQRQE